MFLHSNLHILREKSTCFIRKIKNSGEQLPQRRPPASIDLPWAITDLMLQKPDPEMPHPGSETVILKVFGSILPPHSRCFQMLSHCHKALFGQPGAELHYTEPDCISGLLNDRMQISSNSIFQVGSQTSRQAA